MKQCPRCLEKYNHDEMFCELDGSPLVDNLESVREALAQAQPLQARTTGLVTGVIGALLGTIVCMLLYVIFILPYSGQPPNREQPSRPPVKAPETATRAALAPPIPTVNPVATELPSPLESPSVVDSPSPVAVSASPTPNAILNSGPIATGTRHPSENEKAIILLKDGTSMEADAAWQDSQGVWFRRSGVVSFLERSRVEKITEPVAPKPAAAETPTAGPR